MLCLLLLFFLWFGSFVDFGSFTTEFAGVMVALDHLDTFCFVESCFLDLSTVRGEGKRYGILQLVPRILLPLPRQVQIESNSLIM